MRFPKILEKFRIKADEAFDDIVDYLVNKYRQSKKMFTPSTSFGQILSVLNNHMQIMLYYVQSSISELNINQAYKNQSIYGHADNNGHQRKTATSSKGEITIKPLANSQPKDIYIPNYTKIICENNNLSYLLNLNSDFIITNVSSTKELRLQVLQGEIETARFTGTGEDLQSFEIETNKNTVVSEDGLEVFVNGKKAKFYDSIYKIPFMELGVVKRNSITSQIALVFGNSINAAIPPLGSEIIVDYITCAGLEGNVIETESISMLFKDTSIDSSGNEVDLNDYFEITLEQPINLGSNPEPVGLTKIIAPMFNGSGLIFDENSVKYYFLKMNIFKSVITWKDDINQVNTLPIIDIENLLKNQESYFSVSLSKFSLSDLEINRIINAIESSGNKSSNLQINVIKPSIKRFVMIINAEIFNTINGKSTSKQNLKNKIKAEVSEYLLRNKRHNKIPTSDLVRILDNMEEIDTVTVNFISENGGIDSYGNIKVENNELAVIRGGWEDTNGVFYNDGFNTLKDENQSVNVFLTTINIDRSQI